MQIEIPDTKEDYSIYNHKKECWEPDTEFYEKLFDGKKYEQVFVKNLTSFIGIAGSKATVKLLIYIMKNKDTGNVLLGSQVKISKDSGVSVACVKKVFRQLQEKGLIRLVQRGAWMLDPKIMRLGGTGKLKVLMMRWDKI